MGRVCMAAVGVVVALTTSAEFAAARTLSANLHQFLGSAASPLQGVQVVEPISGVVERIAAQGTDFPVTSTAPGFTYSYNPDLKIFERSTAPLGPTFNEWAETIGRGRFDLGFSYLYANLKDFGGQDFGKLVSVGTQIDVNGTPTAGFFQGKRFSLVSQVFNFSATYGITDRLDVNLLLPLITTRLELEGTAAAAVGQQIGVGQISFAEFFGNEAFGPGDLLLRAKYRFLDGPGPKLAALLTVRFPTGSQGDFQGLGDYIVTPGLTTSYNVGVHDIHGQLGVDLNAGDLQRCRARYGLGATLRPLERLAFMADVIGSSAFQDDTFSISSTGGVIPDSYFLVPSEFVQSLQPTSLVGVVPRTDVVDLAVGFKVNIVGTLIAFAEAIVPLTNDGLHANAIPTWGLEFTF